MEENGMDYNALAWLAGAGGILLLTVVLVAVNTAAMRGHQGPETVVFARSPIPMVICGVIAAALTAVPAFVPIDSDNVSLLILPGLFVVLFGAMFAQYYLVFWVADATGLTRQALVFEKTLPWHEVDWVYGSVKTTNYRAYGIVPVGKSTQHDLIVEAGPKRKIKIGLKAFLSGGKPEPLMRAIEQRATGAQFGFDKFGAVRQRRMAGAVPGGR